MFRGTCSEIQGYGNDMEVVQKGLVTHSPMNGLESELELVVLSVVIVCTAGTVCTVQHVAL